MVESKNGKGGSRSTSEGGSASRSGGSRESRNKTTFNLSEEKLHRLYDVLEAFIDTLEMPGNRQRALKYGLRAVGEFLTPENEEESGGSRTGRSSGSRSSQTSGSDDSEGGMQTRRG